MSIISTAQSFRTRLCDWVNETNADGHVMKFFALQRAHCEYKMCEGHESVSLLLRCFLFHVFGVQKRDALMLADTNHLCMSSSNRHPKRCLVGRFVAQCIPTGATVQYMPVLVTFPFQSLLIQKNDKMQGWGLVSSSSTGPCWALACSLKGAHATLAVWGLK